MLQGVVDLRELILSDDAMPLGEVMVAPVVAAESDDVREDLEELFAKYHYRMIPVVDRGGSPAGRDPLQGHHERPRRPGGLAVKGKPATFNPCRV